MSVPAVILWDQAYNRNGDPKLQRSVVNVIRTYVNSDSLVGWVKAETLAEATGLQIRGVRKQIAANVKAGWLEVIKSGNSSGLANTYRLTYPNGVPQDTLATDGQLQRVSHRTPLVREGCPTGPVKGVLQDTPTSPRTSPKEKFIGEGTSPEKGVPQDTLATDPFFGSGIRAANCEATSQSNGVPQDTLQTFEELESAAAEFDLPADFDEQFEAFERQQDSEPEEDLGTREHVKPTTDPDGPFAGLDDDSETTIWLEPGEKPPLFGDPFAVYRSRSTGEPIKA